MKYLILIFTLLTTTLFSQSTGYILDQGLDTKLETPYAGMYVTDSDVDTVSLGTINIPVKQADFTYDNANGFTFSTGGRLTYTGSVTRNFIINTSFSVRYSANNSTVKGHVYLNGVVVPRCTFKRKIGTGADVGNGGCACRISMDTDDYIEVWWESDLSGTLYVDFGNITIN